MTLSGDTRTDYERVTSLLSALRGKLPYIPDDPYLLYSTQINSNESIGTDQLPDAKEALIEILSASQGHDFVGLYAAGGILTGFANSLGQRNWHSRYSFNLDWSFYHDKDKAVKSAYAGFNWENSHLKDKIAQSLAELEILKRQPQSIEAGQYRVYLAPAALSEILQLLCWGGFGLKAQRSKESPLLRMLEAPGQHLHPSVSLTENTGEGAACRMTGMTRFATFWVENGEIVAPLSVMRFDETLYHILGDKLMALTAEREFILSTYEARSTGSVRLPGALVEDFSLTL